MSGRCIGQYYNGFAYIVSGTNITISGYGGYAGAVTIPSSIPGVNGTVTAIANWADFGWSTTLTSVSIPSSVTSIAADVFGGCSGLTAFTVDSQNPFYSSLGNVLFDKSQTVLVTWPPGKGGAYTIPSTVTSVGDFAFTGCSGLTNLTIPNSVTAIGKGAFVNCGGLTGFTVDTQSPSYSSLDGVLFDENRTALVAWPSGKGGAYTIPSSVTSVRDYAFDSCSGLTSLTIPSSVRGIGEGAFFGCSGLTSLTIPSSVTNIGVWAFAECSGLTSLTIPDSVTAIGEEAFDGCSGLTSVTIPSSVTAIGYGAFRGCSGLTSLSIPSRVMDIGAEAFAWCTNLTSLTIPSGVTSIGGGAFSFCNRLTAFTVETQNPSYSSLGGVLFDRNQTTLTAWPPGKGGAYTIPSSVTSIAASAFNHCTGLTSVTIPNSVTAIGDEAFNECSGLTNVTMPSDLTDIGGYTFAWCSGLTSLAIPSSVTNIGAWAFASCRSLTSLSIPSSLANIGAYAFSGCSGLTNVIIPSGVSDIEDYGFAWCSSLTNLTIPNSVTNIGEGAFSGCIGLTSVTIPRSVTVIGKWAFDGCSALTSLTIPSSVTSIGEGAFSGCSGLTAFMVDTQNPSYSSLSGVLFDKNQTTLVAWPPGEGGAYTIPSSVTSIGDFAFTGCSGLTSVTIPSNVTSIGGYAFSRCSGLTSVTIPGSVTAIGEEAFASCSGLTSAYFQGDALPTFRGWVFEYTAPGFSLYYPSNASGWSTPTWNGWPAQPYDYSLVPPQPLLTLIFGSGAVAPSFNHLQPGRSYQLQVSSNLVVWNNAGVAFIATNASQSYPQPFNPATWSRLFFRLQSAP